jgi:hypothetical protein
MLKKAASIVLASFRGSTCRGEPLGYRNHWRGFSVRKDQFNERTAHTKCGLYLLASSLAAALLNGLFEHPVRDTRDWRDRRDERDARIRSSMVLKLRT